MIDQDDVGDSREYGEPQDQHFKLEITMTREGDEQPSEKGQSPQYLTKSGT